MNDFFALYDVLLEGVPALPVLNTLSGDFWTGVETREGLGLAMTTPGDTAPRLLSQPALSLKALAQGGKSWNFAEASLSMAAINAGYNTEEHLRQLQAQDYRKYDLLIGMDNANIRNMRRICGGDPDEKIHLLMDYAGQRGKEVADPWYTGDFETTWQNVLSGCQGLLKALGM